MGDFTMGTNAKANSYKLHLCVFLEVWKVYFSLLLKLTLKLTLNHITLLVIFVPCLCHVSHLT